VSARERTTPELRRMAVQHCTQCGSDPRINDVLAQLRPALREQERLARILASGTTSNTEPYEKARRATNALEFELRDLLLAEKGGVDARAH
jgi:hypothetical protein